MRKEPLLLMMGMFDPYEEHQKEAAIIEEDGIKEAIMKNLAM